MDSSALKGQRLTWNLRLSHMIPWMTLGLGLLATFGGWKLVEHVVGERETLRFEHEVDGLTEDILAHLKAYDVVMRGTVGLFVASQDVSRTEFNRYFEALQLTEDYSGFLNLGFAKALDTEGVRVESARMRAAGYPDFTIHPRVPGNEHAIVVLIEPSDGVNAQAYGFDGMSTSPGSDAMRQARDMGRASLSALTPLLRNTEGQSSSFLMALPVYESGQDPGTIEGRRARLKGYVWGALRLNELIQELQTSRKPLISLAIYDASNGTPGTLIFGPSPEDGTEAPQALERRVDFGGRDWILHFKEGHDFRDSAPIEPKIAAGAGLAFSIILFVLTLILERLERARRHAAEALLSTEKKLRQAQKMEAIGQLTGGVAHDFNNLLQVILGNAELLAEQSAPDSSQRRLAELTQKAAERGAELTNRLLAFARRQALNPKPTDVNHLISGMETLVQRALGEAVQTRFIPDPDLTPALVDAAQLESAVLNLCINARDAMPEGGQLTIETINVTIEARDAADAGDLTPGPYVRLTVRDNGTGMDKATLAQAFEPFFTTKDVGKGSGLGLSMVFGFAKQTGGTVKIESRPGHGATVKLYLPACPRDGDGQGEPHLQELAEGGSETILMVEDHELVRDNVEALLRSLGYDVIIAANGQEALDMLRDQQQCDLLFTDLVMPGGIDGHQLAATAHQIRPDLPVLFTTGYGGKATPESSDSQARRILQKPYRRQELADQIRDLLRRNRTSSSD